MPPLHSAPCDPLPSRSAFTLVELLVACLVLAIGVLALASTSVAVARLRATRPVPVGRRSAGRRASRRCAPPTALQVAERSPRAESPSGGQRARRRRARRFRTACATPRARATICTARRSRARFGAPDARIAAGRFADRARGRHRAARGGWQRRAGRRDPPGAILSGAIRCDRCARYGARRRIATPERAARTHTRGRRPVRRWRSRSRVSHDACAERDLHDSLRHATRSRSRRSISRPALRSPGSARSPKRATRCSCSPRTPRSAGDGTGTCSPLRCRPSAAVPCRPASLPSAAEASAALTLSLAPALDSAVAPGALVRVVRRARYELYRASDAQLVPGLPRLSLHARDAVQRRAARERPLRDRAASSSRISMRAGIVTAVPARVARIDVLAIAARRSAPATLDSLATTIALRN